MQVSDIPGIGQLSVSEKVLLVENLWDSIVVDESQVPVPDSHIQELERRLWRRQSQPGSLLTLEDLQARVKYR